MKSTLCHLHTIAQPIPQVEYMYNICVSPSLGSLTHIHKHSRTLTIPHFIYVLFYFIFIYLSFSLSMVFFLFHVFKNFAAKFQFVLFVTFLLKSFSLYALTHTLLSNCYCYYATMLLLLLLLLMLCLLRAHFIAPLLCSFAYKFSLFSSVFKSLV